MRLTLDEIYERTCSAEYAINPYAARDRLLELILWLKEQELKKGKP